MNKIPLCAPHLTGNEQRYVEECFETNFVSAVGPFVERFEVEFAKAVGSAFAVACSSGTAALHVALRLAGAGPGEIVAVPSFTFIASANAIRYTGADLLLVDSERDTWNMDTERLHDEIQRRASLGMQLPVAVEVVHILGHPADIEPVLDLRERYGIRIVEDAAESLGASYNSGPLAGQQVGTLGDFGCFSFNGNKVMTTGSGGMIVTPDQRAAEQAKHLITQAKLPGRGYVHDEVGYNYRLTNLAAALGLAQLEQLTAFLQAKREIALRYAKGLADLPLTLYPEVGWASATYWLYSVLLNEHSREDILDRLANAGIEARPLWRPVHDQPPYGGVERLGGDVAMDLFRRGISLPSSVGLSPDEQDTVIGVLANELETS